MLKFGRKDRHSAAVLRALSTEGRFCPRCAWTRLTLHLPRGAEFPGDGLVVAQAAQEAWLLKGVREVVQRLEHPLGSLFHSIEPEVDGVPEKRAGLCPWCWCE